jgi:hypothetical protein
MMMGGMGLVMLLGLIAAVAVVGLIALPLKRSEAAAKRKNDEIILNDEDYTIGDDGEIVGYPETKFKRNP